LNERISFIVTAESLPDGTVQLELRAVDGGSGLVIERTVLTAATWLVDRETFRLSVTNPRTGSIAYFQSGESALVLANELGLKVIP
jgi:hypothetical protein